MTYFDSYVTFFMFWPDVTATIIKGVCTVILTYQFLVFLILHVSEFLTHVQCKR